MLARILRTTGTIALGAIIACLLAAMLFGPAIELIIESFDLALMRSTARGTVDRVSVVHGGNATARVRIEYSFNVAGRPFQSDRYLPGYFANRGTWSGGSADAKQYQVGQPVTVYYDADKPSRCALEYGWFKWPVGCAAFVWGMAVYGESRRRHAKNWYGWTALAGRATALYGFGLIFFGPTTVRIADLRWHALAWVAAFGGVALYWFVKGRFGRRGAEPEPEPAYEIDPPKIPSAE